MPLAESRACGRSVRDPDSVGALDGWMAERKVVLLAFARIVRCRDYLKRLSLNTRSPFENIEVLVKEAYEEEWKVRIRTRIRRSDGVFVLASENSVTSTAQKWEIKGALRGPISLNQIWMCEPRTGANVWKHWMATQNQPHNYLLNIFGSAGLANILYVRRPASANDRNVRTSMTPC